MYHQCAHTDRRLMKRPARHTNPRLITLLGSSENHDEFTPIDWDRPFLVLQSNVGRDALETVSDSMTKTVCRAKY